MKIYQVGGAVRDRLLGLEPKDIDYVVVGATEQQMLKEGYQRVGADFPVFLKNGAEYALARKERKVAAGYNGFEVTFDPTVTLQEDLFRRDLTINAMAQDMDTHETIDPFNGQQDLSNCLLRHVSEAFAEDPVRVLRTARFAARYGFNVFPETLNLMAKVAPELNHVAKERIWAEFEKGLAEKHPVKMFKVLHDCGALNVEALHPYRGVDLDCLGAVTDSTPMHARFTMCASLFSRQDWELHRIPSDYARIAVAFDNQFDTLCLYHCASSHIRVTLLDSLRAFSSTMLLDGVLDCFVLCKAKRMMGIDKIIEMIRKDLELAKTVDAAAIAAGCSSGKDIKQTLFAARVAAITL
jgi:tRNA nucleotidyltransferase/poly(A) polymerase